MKSWEVIRNAVRDTGAKSIASDMGVSASLVYKWCEASDGDDASGTGNPLDRTARLYDLTRDTRIVSWLCARAGGFFVPNTEHGVVTGMDVLKTTRSLLSEFSDVLEAVSEGYDDDERINPDEAARIRKEWDELKSVAEAFVVACEKGVFNQTT